MLSAVIAIGSIGHKVLTQGVYGWFDCLYMAVITIITVGFGETIDVTRFPFARQFSIILILFGAGILVYTFEALSTIMWKRFIERIE